MPIIDEYLYSIGAYYDSDSFKKAQRQANKSLNKIIDKWKDYAKAVKSGDKKKQELLLKNMNNFEKAFGQSMMRAAQTAGELELAFKPLLILLDTTKDSLKLIYDMATNVSNQFVGMKSLFVDEDVRNIMAITGVGTVEAQAIRTAEDLTGISIQDLPYATPEQQKMFKDFIDTYTTGINQLDPGKLEEFNKTTQEFQRTIAESKLKLQLAFMKVIIATGPQLESLFSSITETIENFGDLVDSEAFQTGAKLFVATIEGIVDIISAPINIAGSIADFFNKETVETGGVVNTNTNITINSNASFQGNPSQEIGIARKYSRDNALYIAENVGGIIK